MQKAFPCQHRVKHVGSGGHRRPEQILQRSQQLPSQEARALLAQASQTIPAAVSAENENMSTRDPMAVVLTVAEEREWRQAQEEEGEGEAKGLASVSPVFQPRTFSA